MPSIRPADLADASPICAVAIEVWLHTYLAEGVALPAADHVLSLWAVDRVRKALAAPSQSVRVSQAREGIDGFLWLDRGPDGPEIATLYVRPCRQRRGSGTKLLDACLHEVSRGGGGRVWLTVNAANDRALAFYGRHGFADDGPSDFLLNGQAIENRRMARIIEPGPFR